MCWRRGAWAKAAWCYERSDWKGVLKVMLTDGTPAMVIYRLMQWARWWRLIPLELAFNRLNTICCGCVIGRGAEFGAGFVLVHSLGVVINGSVRGGRNAGGSAFMRGAKASPRTSTIWRVRRSCLLVDAIWRP